MREAKHATTLDLSKPSYRAAYSFARALGDRTAASALLSRLLWHVESHDGGFIGLSDAELEAKVAADPRLNMQAVTAAMYAPGAWPATEQRQQRAA